MQIKIIFALTTLIITGSSYAGFDSLINKAKDITSVASDASKVISDPTGEKARQEQAVKEDRESQERRERDEQARQDKIDREKRQAEREKLVGKEQESQAEPQPQQAEPQPQQAEPQPFGEITPLGKIEWNDELYEIIDKVNAMGANTIQLKIGRDYIDVKGVGDKRTADERLGQLLGSVNQSRWPIKSYIQKDGTIQEFVLYDVAVKATDININGVLYELEAILSPSVGAIVNKPQSVYVDKKNGVAMSLALSEVELVSHSPLLPDKIESINELILKKLNKKVYDNYGNEYDSLQMWNGVLSGSTGDEVGHSARVDSGEKESFISYSYDDFEKDNFEIYRKHEASFEESKQAGKVDMGSSL